MMPGRGSYGPGGKWIHDRAHRIMESSPETPKSVAYATATQQAHKVGKSPKKFRTRLGVAMAKAKFDKPKKEYKKTAAAHPFEFTLKGMLIKEALGKKKRQQAQRRKAKLKQPPKTKYKSPQSYVGELFERAGGDPGDAPKKAFSARVKAREKGIRTKSGRLQPYTVRQRAGGVPKPPRDTGPRVQQKQKRKGQGGRAGGQQPGRGRPAPQAQAPRATGGTVRRATQQASKLRRYGLPVGLGLAGAAAIGGAAYLASRKKKQQADIEKFWKGKKKRAMVEGMVDELQKIAQGGGSLSNRLRLGGTSPAAQESIQSAVQGNVGTGGTQTPPPSPTTPPPPAPTDPGGGGGGAGLDMPGANPFGPGGPPGGGDPLGGAGGGDPTGGTGGGNPLSPSPAATGTTKPPPPPPPTGSLLSPKRQGFAGTTTEGPP